MVQKNCNIICNVEFDGVSMISNNVELQFGNQVIYHYQKSRLSGFSALRNTCMNF